MNLPTPIAALHACYESCTGIQLPLNRAFSREYEWSRFMAQGWTENDLRLVINYLRKEFREHWLKMVRFSKLICDHESFEEWLAMARAAQRNAPRPPNARSRALAAIGRPTEAPVANCRQAGAIAEEVLKAGWEQLKRDANL